VCDGVMRDGGCVMVDGGYVRVTPDGANRVSHS
jgi:hypothetical protein